MAEHKVQWLQNVKAITVSWITDGGAGGGVESQQRIHIQILLLLFVRVSKFLFAILLELANSHSSEG